MTATAVGLVSVAGLVFAHFRASRTGVIVFKVIAASCFVWAAIGWGALSGEYGRVLLAGLVLCWFGDVFLLSSGQSTGFKLGIAAFLLGHVAYGVAFAGLGINWAVSLAAVIVVAVIASKIHGWLAPHLSSSFAAPVRAYLAVISLMVVLAVGAAWETGAWLIAVGAVGFAASDIAVARGRFVAAGFSNNAWGTPLYFASQYVLAATVAVV